MIAWVSGIFTLSGTYNAEKMDMIFAWQELSKSLTLQDDK